MWICVEDTDSAKEAWVGTITPHEGPNTWWEFELIRRAEMKDIYRKNPFEGGQSTVVGLLDYQRQCTLIRPLVHYIDPGSLGVRIGALRTRITGQFAALLSDLAVLDAEKETFSGIAFRSDVLSAWYAPSMYKTDYDNETQTHAVSISETKKDEINLAIGRVTCTSGVELSSHVRSGAIKSATAFRLEFSAPASLNAVIATCFGLDGLFGFLIGFRGKPPVFYTWLNETYKVGEHELSHDGTLDIAGLNWIKGDPPHPMDCIHVNGLGGASLQLILERFLADQENAITQINAVAFSRFFSKNINERFLIVMPVLESYVRRKYVSPDEASYIQHAKQFFKWIDESESEEITEFCRKHIEVRDAKSPSLKTLLTRAIDEVNRCGFRFPSEMANRIQKRRGCLFHTAPQMKAQEVRELFDEVQAATGLLMLHTYLDLGIDIACLANRYFALRDFRTFLVPPPEYLGQGSGGE